MNIDGPLAEATAAEGSRKPDTTLALCMAVCAFATGIATHIYAGFCDLRALLALTCALVACVVGVLWPGAARRDALLQKWLRLLLSIAIFLQSGLLLLNEANHGAAIQWLIVVLSLLALLNVLNLERLRAPIAAFMIAGFFAILLLGVYRGRTGIDVHMFQARAADALWHGQNPYAVRYPNVYGQQTPFYGPGVVDASDAWLNYGFPYPPLSLLMSMVGFLAGDVRIADALAAAIVAALIFAARPGRINALAASLLILTPLSLLVIYVSWTETLLALSFSLVMFCACRRGKFDWFLPIALGLFFATKQYAILSLPLLLLLVGKKNQVRELARLILIAGLVGAAITLPFLLWNPTAFIRAVVLFQMFQPFRPDAISYPALIYALNGHHAPSIWISFAALFAALLLALWRCPRTPAGYAAGVTFVNLTFFVFNKQAFPNYYYFVVVTACWALAATDAAAPAWARRSGTATAV